MASSAPVVSIRKVTHRYKKVVALDGISLDIPAGIMVGIVGPDGVGKSTLMALVAGSKKLQEGGITVLGGPVPAIFPSFGRSDTTRSLPFGAGIFLGRRYLNYRTAKRIVQRQVLFAACGVALAS